MEIMISNQADSVEIRLSGSFDFNSRDRFMAIIEGGLSASPSGDVRIDLSEVDYVDSSALGMLLMLRDRARKLDKTVRLEKPQGAVRQVLETSQFTRLFQVT